MKSHFRGLHWDRLAVEGVVIVVSILLAFAIDAWWDGHKQRQGEYERPTRFAMELRANADVLEARIRTLETAISATNELLSWMGPEPDSVPQDVFDGRWEDAMSIGTFSLFRHAANDFLAGSEVNRDGEADLRGALFEWYAGGDSLEKHYQLLREAHARVFDYLMARYPMYHLSTGNNVMAGHPRSKFPHDDTLILADPLAENMFGVYLIRLEFVTRRATGFRDEQARVLALIEARLRD